MLPRIVVTFFREIIVWIHPHHERAGLAHIPELFLRQCGDRHATQYEWAAAQTHQCTKTRTDTGPGAPVLANRQISDSDVGVRLPAWGHHGRDRLAAF